MKKSLEDTFIYSSDELVNLLKQMVQFNPHFRPSAKELLENKIFDKFRRVDLEEDAPFKLNLDIDDKEAEGEQDT